MVIVQTYSVAVLMCFVTMICWGSWASTMKLTAKHWSSQLYYWDYAMGVVLFAVFFALTLGSFGDQGRAFIQDLRQAALSSAGKAFVAGIIFNLSNVLLVTVIQLAGLAVAFPVTVGFALITSAVESDFVAGCGAPLLFFGGMGCITLAVILDAVAYSRVPGETKKSITAGITLAVLAGVLMGFFYPILKSSVATNWYTPEPGKLTPYTAIVIFSIALFLSSFLWDYAFMRRPVAGSRVSFHDYFKNGSPKDHLLGLVGGLVWCTGFSLMMLGSGEAGSAISYGLEHVATLVAALWGVFVWQEFNRAPPSAKGLLAAMFIFYFAGLVLLMVAKS